MLHPTSPEPPGVLSPRVLPPPALPDPAAPPWQSPARIPPSSDTPSGYAAVAGVIDAKVQDVQTRETAVREKEQLVEAQAKVMEELFANAERMRVELDAAGEALRQREAELSAEEARRAEDVRERDMLRQELSSLRRICTERESKFSQTEAQLQAAMRQLGDEKQQAFALAPLQAEADHLSREVDAQGRVIAALREQLQRERQDAAAALRRADDLARAAHEAAEREVTTARIATESAEAEAARTRQEADALRRQASASDTRAATCLERLAELEQEVDELAQQALEHVTHSKRQEREQARLEHSLQSAEEAAADLKEQCTMQEGTNRELAAAVREAAADRAAAEEAAGALRTEADLLREEVRSARATAASLRDAQERQSGALVAAVQELESMSGAVRGMQAEIRDQASEIATLKVQREDLERGIEEERRGRSTERARADASDLQVAVMKKEVEALGTDLAEHRSALDLAAAELSAERDAAAGKEAELLRHIESLEHELAGVRRTVVESGDSARIRAAALEADLSASRDRIQALEQENAEARSALAAATAAAAVLDRSVQASPSVASGPLAHVSVADAAVGASFNDGGPSKATLAGGGSLYQPDDRLSAGGRSPTHSARGDVEQRPSAASFLARVSAKPSSVQPRWRAGSPSPPASPPGTPRFVGRPSFSGAAQDVKAPDSATTAATEQAMGATLNLTATPLAPAPSAALLELKVSEVRVPELKVPEVRVPEVRTSKEVVDAAAALWQTHEAAAPTRPASSPAGDQGWRLLAARLSPPRGARPNRPLEWDSQRRRQLAGAALQRDTALLLRRPKTTSLALSPRAAQLLASTPPARGRPQGIVGGGSDGGGAFYTPMSGGSPRSDASPRGMPQTEAAAGWGRAR